MTNQKLIILDFLRKSKDHPSADDVFLAVRKTLPQISKATVYRILDGFVKDSIIQNIDGKLTRFDGNDKAHQHFICTECGNIADLYDDTIEEYLKKKRSLIKNGSVKKFSVDFYGICNKCKKDKKI